MTQTRSDLGAIDGLAADETGRPLAEAAVLIAEGPPHPDIAALTDAEGRFRLTDLLPGVYTILVNAEDREPQRQTVEVAAGQAASITVTFGPAS